MECSGHGWRAAPWTGAALLVGNPWVRQDPGRVLLNNVHGVGPGRPALRWLNALGPDGGLDDRPREHKSYLDAFIRLRLRRWTLASPPAAWLAGRSQVFTGTPSFRAA